MRGMKLLSELSEATGLPDDMIGEELSKLISTAGKTTDEVTLDDLREMLGAYLQDVLLEAKESLQGEAHAEVQQAAAELEAAPQAVVVELKPAARFELKMVPEISV